MMESTRGEDMWIWPIISYLFAGINGAYVVTKYKLQEDITMLGSGTGGARNAGRMAGEQAFIWTVVIDALKTILPLSLALYLSVSPVILAAMVISSVAGHIWSIWLKGRGGKGVVVYLACTLVLEWPGLLIFGGAALLAKFLPVSFSKVMLGAMIIPVVSAFFRGDPAVSFGLLIGYGLVVLSHLIPVHPGS
ncbi:glycerol-3-phosphate acyltransferase [Halobacillus litoralis]|uniref:Glycerol-3-phosphate acyltransferase n=2 Tax=Halobacillus litoralis TaxID=45668 RepID=A0A845F9N9_9BACI|nr:glycerol-3-phosphate acyltransferase [Halobacillus litoralis]